ncbi:HWE histidine kinase domain-containing protein [Roseomonas sp. CCTCC AB2023176]|uniref:HWE histidine kinase domain-containing protein n=1 Tax=Roseomonas sp. CCTCC AB2023176 TaxID=3342640 RepID=UPI0035E1A2F9
MIFAARRLEGYPIYALVGRPLDTIRAGWGGRVRAGLFWLGPGALALVLVALFALRQARRAARTAAALQAETARRAAEARFRGVFESGAFGMSVYDLRTGETLLINDRLLEMTGRTRAPHGGPAGTWRDVTPPDHLPADQRALEQARARGWWDPYEKEYLLPDGARIPVRVHSAPLPGEPGRIAVMVEDISAQREAESRRDLLMHEVNHRAKNALAAARAALRLTRAPTMPEFVEAVDGRLAALATAMGTLSAGGWSAVSLTALARDALAPFRGAGAPGDRILTDGPDLKIQPLAVLPISMILHELATNAGKHGALSVPDGRVTLRWRVEEDRLLLSWAERGGPPAAAPRGAGFGTRLLDATVARQLGGLAHAEWGAEGLSWRADLPLARIATAPPALVPA